MRQNANVMHAVRQQLSDPHHSPTAILSEVAGQGVSNFIEGQKILLDLGQQQNEILLSGVKERVGDWPAVTKPRPLTLTLPYFLFLLTCSTHLPFRKETYELSP